MNNLCVRSIEEAIRNRYSVRSYNEEELSEEIIEEIEEYINALENPFDINIRVRLVKKEKYDGVVRLGTYGVINGANYYLVAACEKDDFALEALGYTFEKAILHCTSLGLRSVWLGGTFSKSAFEKTINLKEKEILPVVAPIGYEGGQKSFLSSFIKDNSNNRKDFSYLFFDKDFTKPFIKAEDVYSQALEMVRLAPSSLNSQPWKIVKDEDNFYVYSSGRTKLNKIDIGIALCHLDLYLKENGINGEFKFDDPKLNSKYQYVISWIKK